jgi:hypothetical protein
MKANNLYKAPVGLWAVLVVGALGSARGIEPELRPVSLEPRVPVGKAEGSLLVNRLTGRPWRTKAKGEVVFSRDLLLALPGTQAALAGPDGAVGLTLWSAVPSQSELPVWGTKVILHDSRAFDLDFTLVAGRVILRNHKDRGAARVWMRLPDAAWELTLSEPGTEVAVDLYGRWPRGTLFVKDPGAGHRPTQLVDLVMLKGEGVLNLGGTEHALRAPPGPAEFHWDSVGGASAGPQRRERVPAWVSGEGADPGMARRLREVVSEYQGLQKGRTPAAALVLLLNASVEDKDPKRARLEQEFALLGLAALDEATEVARVLDTSEQPGIRAVAVLALRHWIGTTAGHDRYLYRALIDRLGYPAPQAEAVLQLLHNPFSADEPGTYQTLIAYLRHSKQSVRELAHWHLIRLVPQGRKFGYDAAASEAERAKAQKAWRELIPSGSLPPVEKKKD